MPRAALVVLVLLLTVVAASSVTSRADPAEGDRVTVTNFPPLQKIAGEVRVVAPVPSTRLEVLRAQVAPSGANDTNDWTDAGTLDTAGFAWVTLNLGGYVQGRLATSGTVAAVLIPEQPDTLAALRESGVRQFPLVVTARVAPTDAALFQSEQTSLRLGFPRYRVYLYNATPRTAQAVLYAYLGNA